MMHKDKDGRYEANSREVQAIEFLAGMEAQLRGCSDILKERIDLNPGKWRMYRAACGMVTKVIECLYDTLPKKTLRHLLYLHEHGEVIVRPRPVRPDYVQIVANDDLKTMVNTILQDECAMCSKYARHEWKPCQLRKMLMRVAPPADIDKAICPYMDICSQGKYGDYFTYNADGTEAEADE